MIRFAVEADIPEILEIYAPYILNTAYSFEYTVPTLEEFTERFRSYTAQFPWLVWEEDGRVLGYAYASRFHPRAAYDWCAEVSIYLDRNERGRGLGRKLYERLEHGLRSQGVLTAYSCIAHTQEPDEYLDHASIRFHERMGYRPTGSFPNCGFKFGRWYGMVWMEKRLAPEGTGGTAPAPVVPFRMGEDG